MTLDKQRLSTRSIQSLEIRLATVWEIRGLLKASLSERAGEWI